MATKKKTRIDSEAGLLETLFPPRSRSVAKEHRGSVALLVPTWVIVPAGATLTEAESEAIAVGNCVVLAAKTKRAQVLNTLTLDPDPDVVAEQWDALAEGGWINPDDT